MVSENLKNLLLNRDSSNLEFGKLVKFLEESKIEFIGASLKGPMGMATCGKAYFDLNRFEAEDDQLIFFIILHEYCHVLKIDKIGKDEMIRQLASDDFDLFINHLIEEEILADRFGSIMYYVLNKKKYPNYRTQMLHLETQQHKYVEQVDDLFGVIKDEETYNKTLNSFIDELD